MATYDSDSLILESTAASSLPDPATVPQRAHWLSNTGPSGIVWSSVGATPFQLDGVNTATLTVGVGNALRVQSDGTHWVVIRPVGSRPGFAGTVATDASGNAVFPFAAGLFPAAPVVAVSVQFPASSNPLDYRVTALTATSCTVNVRQSPTLVVLSLSVLGVSAPIAGVTVHLIATPAGSNP